MAELKQGWLSPSGEFFECCSFEHIEIARFKGYLDEDMIYRLQMAIKRLPDEIVEVLPADYDRFYRKMAEMEGR